MDKKSIRKSLLKDCLPTIFSLLLSGLYSVMDGLFVGRAAGDTGLAAVNLAWPVVAVINAAGIGIGSGGSVLLSNFAGRKEEQESDKTYHLTVTLLMLAGLSLTVVLYAGYPWILRILGAEGAVFAEAEKYIQVIIAGAVLQILGTGFVPLLRNKGMAVHAMAGMVSGMVVNLILNDIFIFKMGLGMRGAALGTISAQLVVIVISVYLIYVRRKNPVRLVLDWERTKKIFKIGVSAFGLSIAPSIVLIFTNYQCLRYGGEAAVACYAVISYIVFPVQSMLVGVGDGSQPLMSFYCGAEKKEELAYIQRAASRAVVLLGAVLMVVVMGTADKIPWIFGMSADSEAFFHRGMRISAISFLFTGLAKFHISYLNATMQVKPAMGLIYGETLAAAPLLLMVLPRIFGMDGIWLSLAATQILMLLVYWVMKRKHKKTDA